MNNPTVSDLFRAFALRTFGLSISPEDNALAERELTRLRAVELTKALLGNGGSRDTIVDFDLAHTDSVRERLKNPADGLEGIIRAIEAEIRKVQPDWTPTESCEGTDSFDDIEN